MTNPLIEQVRALVEAKKAVGTYGEHASMLLHHALNTDLPQVLKDLEERDYLRPEVRAFAKAMETKLRANDHKPGWKRDSPFDLLRCAKQELTELEREARKAFDETSWPNPAYVDGDWHTRFIERFATDDERAEIAANIPLEAADLANYAMMIADVCAALKENSHE